MSEVLEAPPRPAFANFVGGEWRQSSSGKTYEKRGPWRPSETIGEFPASSAEDVDAAVEAAAAAFPAWSRRPAAQRAAILMGAADAIERRVEQIAQDMTLEMGKPLREARMEAARGAAILRYFAGEAWRPKGELFEQSATGSSVYTVRRSLGVVGLITPWNFPAAIPAWKTAPALVYGNTVVMKLAQEAPLTGLHLAACLEEAGIPAGVFNIVVGRGSEVGTPLVRHPKVKAISFTGSVAVGHQVRDEATALGKRVQLELGGHNPLIVMADADLDRAVEAAYAGAFWSAGQKCTATRRIYVQDAVYDDFRAGLLDRVERGALGDPTDPDTEVGPIVNEKQLDEILAGIERGKAEGGTVVPAASGSTTTPTCSRRPCSKAWPTTRSSRARRSSARSRRSTASPTSTRPSAGRTRSSSASRRRSSRATWRTRSASSTSSRRASCTSTRRRPAPTSTSPSAGSRAPASARTSRAARRWSSIRRSSPSTTMSDERWLVTGALGCIGAWTAVTLVREGVGVVAFDLSDDDRRLRLIADRRQELDPITFVRGDITDLRTVERVLAEHEITHVVHLAALQVPFCRENPVLCAHVNVTGTVNVFEAAKRLGLANTIAYASSAAVYDQQGAIAPSTLYGVYKVANEGIARVYAAEQRRRQRRATSVHGLRPGPRPGPDRRPDPRDRRRRARRALPDRLRRTHPVPLCGGRRPCLHPGCALGSGRRAGASPSAGRRRRSPTSWHWSAGRSCGAEITHDDAPLPFPDELPGPWFDAPLTPLEEGLRETAATLRSVV